MIQILKGNHSFQNYVKNVHAWDTAFPHAPIKDTQNHSKKPNCQKQTFNQAMKGNQNLPNKQVTSKKYRLSCKIIQQEDK